MSLRAWRTAYGSAPGTAHARTGTPCQDAGRCDVLLAVDGTEVLVASVADGAGSAARSERGAWLMVEAFQRAFGELAQGAPDLGGLDEAHARDWLAAMQAAIVRLAEAEGGDPAEYACTFLGAVVAAGCAAFMQIGDGAIVVGDSDAGFDGHAWIFWPQHGEFANSTFFVTMPDAARHLRFEKRPGTLCELALFSDGLERLILDMRARTVHSPSLRPVLGWLAGTEPGRDCAPSDVLLAYLDSAHVNRRTDDDKTLVVATRALPGP